MKLPLDVDTLQAATDSTPANAEKYLAFLNAGMDRFNIHSHVQIAAFLATVQVESARLSTCEESLYYTSAERLAKIYPRLFKTAKDAEPYVRNHNGLSQGLYDGYHGRGLIQLTWKRNYEACSKGLGVDFVAQPTLLLTPEYAALSACWFWATNGCNEVADDMERVTEIVNGKAKMHLHERMDAFAKNLLL